MRSAAVPSLQACLAPPSLRTSIPPSGSHILIPLFQHLAPVLAPKLSNTFPDVVAKRGSSILLEAPVLSGELLQYQWKRDGQNITGANGATLQISNDDDHEYSVVVSNVFGSLERTRMYATPGEECLSSQGGNIPCLLMKMVRCGVWAVILTVTGCWKS